MSNLWQAWKGDTAFPIEIIDTVREQMNDIDKETGIILSQDGASDLSDVRRSKVKFIQDDYIKNILYGYVLEANRVSFGYDITQCCDIQYTEYHASEKGHYDWHEDWAPFLDKPFQRKLSVTVQLSDPSEYEGGQFEMNAEPLPDWITEKGTVLVFPSFLSHRVSPVTKGIRRSLVAWFEGPRWR